jgi:hypothetical protein
MLVPDVALDVSVNDATRHLEARRGDKLLDVLHGAAS